MYRVKLLLKQFQIDVHGDGLYVRFVVKKDDSKVNLPKKYRLVDGVANINDEFEFYIGTNKSRFILLALLDKEKSKSVKLAGQIDIQLKGQELGKEFEITSHLENCPESTLSLTIVLEIENSIELVKSIESSAQVDRRIYLKEIKEIRDKLALTQQTMKKYTQEYEKSLSFKDKQIQEIHREAQNAKKRQDQQIDQLRRQLNDKEEVIEQYDKELMQAKKKFADMVDILNEIGDGSLLEKVQNLMNE